MQPAPVTVIVPTIGRAELLERCVTSILACDPPPAEVVVVDQSHGPEIPALASRLGVRHVADAGRGIARATNNGLRAATHDWVMRTDDDCTVAPDWVGVAVSRMAERPDGCVTGQVRAVGDEDGTPSTITDPDPRDLTGGTPGFYVYAGNMVVNRVRALELGGFDERDGLRVAAEDNDFSWRWMDAGLPLRYEPSMVVWHHDWRDDRSLRRRYRAYARGQGALYAKHDVLGDRRVRVLLRADVRRGFRAVRAAVREPARWRRADEERALLLGIPVGYVSERLRALRSRPRRARG